MSERDIRPPDYEAGRFFISPLLGCSCRCSFCYIISFGYGQRAGEKNRFGLERTIESILHHPRFRGGPKGSILSIGAWGDPLPRSDQEGIEFTLSWLRALTHLGNPVQIMSRFGLDDFTAISIADSAEYPSQIMYSTSITTVRHWEIVERGSDSPQDRLETLRRMQTLGVPANLMIKPFVPGITDLEFQELAELMTAAGVNHCVVGELYWDDRMLRSLNLAAAKAGVAVSIGRETIRNGSPLDCAPGEILNFQSGDDILPAYVGRMWELGVAAFRKSACVSSWISGVDLQLRERPEYARYCVDCGMCQQDPLVTDHRV